jgi:uncharacterized protein (TIGR02996 family)
MTDREGEALFLLAVLENPADDLVRLAFADWLDEHEELHRADVIRRGVRKPKRFTFAVGAPAVISYRSGHLGAVEVVAAPAVPGVAFTTCRGFVEGITCSTVDFLTHAPYLFKLHPLETVRLTDREPFDMAENGVYWEPGYRYDSPWQIPFALSELLSRKANFLGGLMIYDYPDRDAAHAALSAAAIAYGRPLPGTRRSTVIR